MLPKSIAVPVIAIVLSSGWPIAAQSLAEILRAADVPRQLFGAEELSQRVADHAINAGKPFLLAYYAENESGHLQPPLRVIRLDRNTGGLRRANLSWKEEFVPGSIPVDCPLGSRINIDEHGSTVYIDIHTGPSSGCIIVLSSALSYKTLLSGWTVGFVGPDYAITERSELHFAPLHPLHIELYDARINRSVPVYPPKPDELRRQYSQLIQPIMSEDWCREHNSPCDPENFETDLGNPVWVNDGAKAFGFEATFRAVGFGDETEKRVSPRKVLYIYRERGTWEHREFDFGDLQALFGVSSMQELVARRPDAAFDQMSQR